MLAIQYNQTNKLKTIVDILFINKHIKKWRQNEKKKLKIFIKEKKSVCGGWCQTNLVLIWYANNFY